MKIAPFRVACRALMLAFMLPAGMYIGSELLPWGRSTSPVETGSTVAVQLQDPVFQSAASAPGVLLSLEAADPVQIDGLEAVPAIETREDPSSTAAAPRAQFASERIITPSSETAEPQFGQDATRLEAQLASIERQLVEMAQKPLKEPATERLSLECHEAELSSVLEVLGRLASVSIVSSPDVQGTVTISLQQVTVQEALKAVLRAQGYAFEQNGNVIFVTAGKESRADRK